MSQNVGIKKLSSGRLQFAALSDNKHVLNTITLNKTALRRLHLYLISQLSESICAEDSKNENK
jgi:hypothetical protein